uniref:CSON009730 protein n=1 Tax=Culicoides sonorensis TaxID=179676 RepID=A0A336LPT0_CULSO
MQSMELQTSQPIGHEKAEMKILEGLSISHLPSFMCGSTLFGYHNRKLTARERVETYLQLPFKIKRKWNSKACLANKKRYVDQINKVVHSQGISPENAEKLIDFSIVNVVNIILDDFPHNSPSGIGLTSTNSENQSGNKNQTNLLLTSHNSNKDLKSLPDAIHESHNLMKKIISVFLIIKIRDNTTIVNYFENYSEWIKWITMLKTMTSISEIQLLIVEKLKELRGKLSEFNLTRKLWFGFVKKFIEERDKICRNQFKSSICTLTYNETCQNFVFKKFERNITFLHHLIEYGHPDFVYVNSSSSIDIVQIQQLNLEKGTFTGLLFSLEKPYKKIEVQKTTILNTVIFYESNDNAVFEYSLHDIIRKCLVLNETDYFKGRPLDLEEKDVYCCSSIWKVNEKILVENCKVPVLENALDKYWGEVYYFSYDGTEKLLNQKINHKNANTQINNESNYPVFRYFKKKHFERTPALQIKETENGEIQLFASPFKIYDKMDHNIKEIGLNNDEDVIVID